MTVEAQIYGYSDWRLPSPSSTPEAHSSASPSLRTPKPARTPTFFINAFSTPRPNGHETPAQTPVYGTFKVVERPASPHRLRHPVPGDAPFQSNHTVGNLGLQLPPVSPGRRLSSSPSLCVTGPTDTGNTCYESSDRSQLRSPMNPFQMQTPPPTRDASSRRKPVPQQMTAMSTPAPIAPRPMQTTPMNPAQMQPPPSLNIQTPFQFNPLQFSPENFGYPGSGPASAPVYPQSRLFWDPNNPAQPQDVNMDMVGMHDSLASNQFGQSPAPVWPSFHHQARMEQYMSQQMSFETPQQPPAQGLSNQTFWSPGDIMPQSTAGPFSSPMHPPPASASDNLAITSFSSPPQNGTETIQPYQTQMSHAQGGRQPYEHQSLQSRREQEVAKEVQHARTSTSSSIASNSSAGRVGLQRSNTDGGTRRRFNKSSDSLLSAQSIEQQILRKASPLKRHSQQSQMSLSAIPETGMPRAKTRLVVDENGTARTEVVPAEVTVDSRRRSGMWEVDSDSDTDDEDITTSQRSSFILTGEPVRRSKQARLDSVVDTSRIGRSASSGSLSKLPFGVRRTTSLSSRRGANKNETRRSSAASFEAASFTTESAERTWDMEGVEDGGAQLALKKVIEDKLKRQEKSPEEKLKAHNQRWSLATADVAKLQPFSFERPSSTPTSHPNISPTMYSHNGEFTTPATGRCSLSQASIRCTCQHNEDDGTQMVQCESCQKWLHTRCIFHNQPVAQIFVCSFCTGFTPLARGGRIRDPMRNNAPPQQQQNVSFVSPLAGRGNNPFR